MTWLLVGTLLGSIVTSEHTSEEACRGRLAMLQKKEVVAQCVQQSNSSGIVCLNGGGCSIPLTGYGTNK